MSGHQLAADYSWWFFLFAFIGSVLLAGQRSLQLFTDCRAMRRLECLSMLLATVVVAVLVVDGLYLVDMPEHPALNATVRICIVTVSVFLIWFQSRLAFGSQVVENRRLRLSSLTLLVISLIIAGWSAHRYYITISPVLADDIAAMQPPGQHVKSQRYVAVTDRGREISLFRWNAANDKDPKVIQSMMSLLMGPLPSVIQRHEPDYRSNCHGWVFTRGRFLLTGDEVAQILQDNRYEVVTSPQEGDVVIYRNSDGGIVHTGLVVGILSDDSVIVESKWSVGSRFLHCPEGQPYSSTFAYYRTTRPNHFVAIRFQNRSDVVDQKRGTRSVTMPSAQRMSTSSWTAELPASG